MLATIVSTSITMQDEKSKENVENPSIIKLKF